MQLQREMVLSLSLQKLMNIKLISVISLATATLTLVVPTFSQSASSSEEVNRDE